MRVWPGLRLMGAGGKIPKGVFVAVAEVEPDGVRLDNGMRLKNQELRATRPSHAVTYQLPALHNRVRLDLESCHLTLRHLYVGASRATSSKLAALPNGQHGASRGSSMRWRTSKSTPHCLPISHTCRASTSARPLRRANSAARGTRLPAGSQKRQRSKSILHFTRLPLALTLTARCSWLSSSVRAAPKGFWKMIMLSMTPCSTSSVHSSRLAPWHWSERPARAQASLRSSFFLSVGKKSGPMNARVFLVVAVAVILLFKNAETFLRHQVGGQGLRGGGLGGRLPGHRVEI